MKITRSIYTTGNALQIDRAEYERLHPTYPVLMERAGIALRNCILRHFSHAETIAIFAGPGNNGGDAYLLAKLLRQANKSVAMYCDVDASDLPRDAQWARDEYLSSGGEVLAFNEFVPQLKFQLLVDGLFGSGLNRDLSPSFINLIALMNAHPAPVLSIDLPSGLNGDTGQSMGSNIRATRTLALITDKQCVFFPSAINDLGVRDFDSLGVNVSMYPQFTPIAAVLDLSQELKRLPQLAMGQHKGDRGLVVVVGGDPSMPGAAFMAAQAALYAGSGKVVLTGVPDQFKAFASQVPELMYVDVANKSKLGELLRMADAIVIGPGLGDSDQAHELLQLVKKQAAPAVYDADALNLISHHLDKLRSADVITPHPGEAKRLLHREAKLVSENRFEAVRRLNAIYKSCCILKGAGSLVCDGDEVSVCPYGNPSMSVPGMGDILAGVVGAFLARGLPSQDAARLATVVHSHAGDLCAQHGESGIVATDMLLKIRETLSGK